MYYPLQEIVDGKTDAELTEIVKNAGEYQPELVAMAIKKLEKNGVDISSYKQENEKKTILEDQAIAAGIKGDPVYIVIAFILAFLGGVLGIAAGLVYSFSKKTDSQGARHYAYDNATRQKGHIMLIVGTVVFLGFLFIKIGI